MNIGIVNDLAIGAEALRRVVSTQTDHHVVWIAENGRVAVERCAQNCPDLILMDLFMPEMDGVEATRRIMAATPCAILIVTASVDGNADRVFAAMGEGALDAVNMPLLGVGSDEEGSFEFLAKIKIIETLTQTVVTARKPRSSAGATIRPDGYQLVALGASSGGPSALATILGQLPADFSVPVVVIQHVDIKFAREFALWLKSQTALRVHIVKNATTLKPGHVYLGDRDEHLVLGSQGQLSYDAAPHASVYRPSVDVFFNSIHRYGHGLSLAVLLSGMGRDGAEGMLRLRNQGHFTIAQDQASSAVYGMPRAAAEWGAASYILPLTQIAPTIMRAVRE